MSCSDGSQSKSAEPTTLFEIDDVVDSIMDPSTISVVVFGGDQGPRIPDLLKDCDYSILSEDFLEGTPAQLMYALQALDTVSESGRPIVHKAFWTSSGITVLIDPEMIISSIKDEQLIAFCSKWNTTATAAVWQRVSETCILNEITPDGVARRTWYRAGQPMDEQVNPRDEIRQDPNQDGLRAAIEAAGLPADDIFGSARVTVLELQE